jgi:hypothetical protein
MILQKTPWVFCWAGLGCAGRLGPSQREGEREREWAEPREKEERALSLFFSFSFSGFFLFLFQRCKFKSVLNFI